MYNTDSERQNLSERVNQELKLENVNSSSIDREKARPPSIDSNHSNLQGLNERMNSNINEYGEGDIIAMPITTKGDVNMPDFIMEQIETRQGTTIGNEQDLACNV